MYDYDVQITVTSFFLFAQAYLSYIAHSGAVDCASLWVFEVRLGSRAPNTAATLSLYPSIAAEQWTLTFMCVWNGTEHVPNTFRNVNVNNSVALVRISDNAIFQFRSIAWFVVWERDFRNLTPSSGVKSNFSLNSPQGCFTW